MIDQGAASHGVMTELISLRARIGLLAPGLLMTGCFYVPPIWDIPDAINHIDFIEPGVTTKEQVLGRLGEPDALLDGGVRYFYGGHSSGGLLVSGTTEIVNSRPWTVSIVFDEHDLVCSIRATGRPAINQCDREDGPSETPTSQ